jgi:hypothetical protein
MRRQRVNGTLKIDRRLVIELSDVVHLECAIVMIDLAVDVAISSNPWRASMNQHLSL